MILCATDVMVEANKIPTLTKEQAKQLNDLLIAAEEAPGPAQAAANYEKALEIDPGNPYALSGLAYMHSDAGRPHDAAKLFEKALERNHPGMHHTMYNAGLGFQKMDNYPKALSMFLAAIQKDPQFYDAYVKATYIQSNSGETAAAIANLEKAIKLNPRKPATYVYLGDTLNNVKRWEEASNYYLKALDMDPRSAHARLHLADTLSNRGMSAEAQAHYLQVYRQEQTPEALIGLLHCQVCRTKSWSVVLLLSASLVLSASQLNDSYYQPLFSPLSF